MPYKDPAVRAAYHREYKRRNRWRYRDREVLYDRTVHANARAAASGSRGSLTQEDVRLVMAVGRCYYCGGTHLLGIEHVIPLSAGGSNTPDNLVCACRSCNARKWCAERPGCWSSKYAVEGCVDCGTNELKHLARGRCNACYQRAFRPEPVRKTARRHRKTVPSPSERNGWTPRLATYLPPLRFEEVRARVA